MNKKTRQATVAISGVVALTLLSAFAHAHSDGNPDTHKLNTNIEQAATAALSSVNGTIIEAELELDDNYAVWEIEIVDESNKVVNVEVDGYTGQILSTESSDDVAPNISKVVSLNQAIDIVRAVDNGALIEMELEHNDDQLIWEIETIGDDSEESDYRINAVTGEFL